MALLKLLSVPVSRVFWIKTAERIVRTYLVGFAAVLLAGTQLFNASVWEAANTAGIAAAGTLVLSLLGAKVGDPNSPSLLDPAGKLLKGLTGCDDTDAPDSEDPADA